MTKTITGVFTDEFREQADEYINLLFKLAKMGDSTVSERMAKVESVTEAYFAEVGQHMKSDKLDRLGTLILYDDHHNTDRLKASKEDYPSLNWRQMKRRSENDVSGKWLETVASDGTDYMLPTHANKREKREKLRLI